ncbi:hypothetical protein J056_002094 [Wallemia ichthyophaga EXF-994]|uniref:Uncharacterized protein n=2 Tax=Wallemia ichthyophaga TaxID=245174 RepID=R9AV88_WALI9|nr:uncharacterized protein J056_002094 [Wallemia ichthyophaga EXF-994]EOR04016.1 hypothetical protein J056_002094 [Wallemia ichthyophaga EXF-994]
MVNIGVYAMLFEFIILGLATAIVTFATQRVMAATAIPEWPSYILGVLCLLVVVIQPIGFIGVFKEKFRLFRRFHWLNTALTLAAFACALAIIIAIAAKQSDAVSQCQSDYYPPFPQASFSLSQYSDDICNILSWVDVGLMGLIWLIMILVQGYFLFIQRRYSSAQRSDHSKYESLYNAPDNYMMATRENAWDARNSNDAYALQSLPSHKHSYTPTSTHSPPPQESHQAYNAYDSYSPHYADKPTPPLPYGARE